MSTLKRCIFCKDTIHKNRNGNHSAEHIFPQWMLGFFNLEKQEIKVAIKNGDQTQIVRGAKSPYLYKSFTATDVCRSCNTGWMSKLEVESRKVLEPLIIGSRTIDELTVKGRRLLARWVAKTAFAMNLDREESWGRKLPDEHLKIVRKNSTKLPEDIFVYAFQHFKHYSLVPRTSDFKWALHLWSSKCIVRVNPAENLTAVTQQDIERAHEGSYKVTFMLGILVITIGYCPDNRFAFQQYRGLHEVVWPPTLAPIYFQRGDEVPDGDSGDEVELGEKYHHSLNLVPRPPFVHRERILEDPSVAQLYFHPRLIQLSSKLV